MNQLPSPDVPSDISKRITSAADQLYEENGKTAFPNVDTVRRRARVNMNDASAVMRLWRRAQTAAAAPPQAAIPDSVQGACQAMLATVWSAANESANSNLQMAQAGWEQERGETEACREQLARAFDGQTEELARLQRHVEVIEKRLAAHADELQVILTEADKLKQAASAAEAKAATAEAKSAATCLRVDDLKEDLLRTHVSGDQQRQEAKQRLEAAEATISGLRHELLQRSAIESNIREELAWLRGQAEVLANQTPRPLSSVDGRSNTPTKQAAPTKSKSRNGA